MLFRRNKPYSVELTREEIIALLAKSGGGISYSRNHYKSAREKLVALVKEKP